MYSEEAIKNIALAYLELKDYGRMSSLYDYFLHRDFSEVDQERIRIEVRRLESTRSNDYGLGKRA